MKTISVDDQKEITDLMKAMLTHIDPCGTHLCARSVDEAFALLTDDVDVLFLDIEMPGISGVEAADLLMKRGKELNIVFVTGHPEYGLSAHSVFPSGFLTKPVDENDIRRALRHLRYPIKETSVLRVRCEPFSVFSGADVVAFKGSKAEELFAYLVYKQGAYCTNDELVTAMWGDDSEKSGRLRQVVMDLRRTLTEAGAENALRKKYGKLGLDTELVKTDGDLSALRRQFGWVIV